MKIINENLSLSYRYANQIANIVNRVENDIKYRIKDKSYCEDFYIKLDKVNNNELYKGESIPITICTPASFKKQCKIRGVTEDALGFYNEYLNWIYIKYDYDTCHPELSNRDKYNILKNKEYRKKNNKDNTMHGLVSECIHGILLSLIK